MPIYSRMIRGCVSAIPSQKKRRKRNAHSAVNGTTRDVAVAIVAATVVVTAVAIAAAIAMIGIAVFAVLNIRFLLWNLSALAAFKKTEAYAKLRQSNGETTLLAAPLATAFAGTLAAVRPLSPAVDRSKHRPPVRPVPVTAAGATLAVWSTRAARGPLLAAA